MTLSWLTGFHPGRWRHSRPTHPNHASWKIRRRAFAMEGLRTLVFSRLAPEYTQRELRGAEQGTYLGYRVYNLLCSITISVIHTAKNHTQYLACLELVLTDRLTLEIRQLIAMSGGNRHGLKDGSGPSFASSLLNHLRGAGASDYYHRSQRGQTIECRFIEQNRERFTDQNRPFTKMQKGHSYQLCSPVLTGVRCRQSAGS